MTVLHRVGVVVPAHDEEELLASSLAALAAARATCQVATDVVVVLDACTDGSAAVAASVDSVHAITVQARCVGAARAAGVAALRRRWQVEGLTADPAGCWVATTDADTRVPPHWLLTQVALAAQGADAVVGTVEPDEEAAVSLRHAWHERHRLAEGHPHVHGANLGVRLDAYERAGGFDPIPTGEDVALVQRLRQHGARVVATDRCRAVTSARTHGRAPEGFARYLRRLDLTSHP